MEIVNWKGQQTLTYIDKNLEKGLPVAIRDMPHDLYHQHKSVSSSLLKDVIKTCPAKAYVDSPFNPDRDKSKTKKCFTIGTGAHDMVLQPDKFDVNNFTLPHDFNGRTKAGKELKASIESQGKNCMTYEEGHTIRKMAKAVREHDFAGNAFINGEAEIAIFWVDEETDVWCRAKPDWLPKSLKLVPDYKTTRDASPKGVEKAINDYLYNMQHAWYKRGIEKVFGKEPEKFFFVFQETSEPYLITCCVPSETSQCYGEMLNRKALEDVAEALKTGVWKGYTDEVLVSHLPVWREMQLEEMTENGELKRI